MKGLQIALPFLPLAAVTFASITCESPTEPSNDFIEPNMISIKEHLTFTYGPSWDTTFVPPVSLPMPVVELEPYKIGKYELTNEEYERFVRDGGYNNPAYWSEDNWNCKITKEWALPLYWSEEKFWLDDPYSSKKTRRFTGLVIMKQKPTAIG